MYRYYDPKTNRVRRLNQKGSSWRNNDLEIDKSHCCQIWTYSNNSPKTYVQIAKEKSKESTSIEIDSGNENDTNLVTYYLTGKSKFKVSSVFHRYRGTNAAWLFWEIESVFFRTDNGSSSRIYAFSFAVNLKEEHFWKLQESYDDIQI